VTTDLTYFDHIVPCGIDDRGVTSLVEETGASVSVDDVRGPVTDHVADLFEAEMIERRGADAWSVLEELTGERVEALGR
jgi:lipoyl(octanoyl) transferase